MIIKKKQSKQKDDEKEKVVESPETLIEEPVETPEEIEARIRAEILK